MSRSIYFNELIRVFNETVADPMPKKRKDPPWKKPYEGVNVFVIILFDTNGRQFVFSFSIDLCAQKEAIKAAKIAGREGALN